MASRTLGWIVLAESLILLVLVGFIVWHLWKGRRK